jgi:hypothetical protein
MTATLDFGAGFTEVVEQAVARALAARDPAAGADDPLRWRDRLWAGPPELRVTTRELAKALGCSSRQVTRLVAAGMPARRRHDAFVFVVGDVRRWLQRHEVVVGSGRVAE